jgi:hypothetical protein
MVVVGENIMKKQHSISATYVMVDDGSGCKMFHPRDPTSFNDARGRTEPDGELSLHSSLDSALHYIDGEANEFMAEEPGRELIDFGQFHSPEYKLPVFSEGTPGIAEVRDVTRVLIYRQDNK